MIVRLTSVAVFAVCAVFALTAHAQGTGTSQQGEPDPDVRAEASSHFRRGVALFAEGDYDAALVEFERAHAAVPNYQVLYNIGQAHLGLRDYVLALTTFERYLELGGAEVPAARRTEVDRLIVELHTRVGQLAITVNIGGAEILVDDDVVGVSPLDPVKLDVGEHDVIVRASGYTTFEQSVTVAGGDHASLDVQLVPAPAMPAVADAATRDSGSDHALMIAGIVGLSLAGATAIGAIVTGVLAFEENNALGRQLSTYPADPAAVDRARSNTQTLSLATDVLTGVAAGLAVVSVVFIAVDSATGESAEERTSAGVRVGPGTLYGWF